MLLCESKSQVYEDEMYQFTRGFLDSIYEHRVNDYTEDNRDIQFSQSEKTILEPIIQQLASDNKQVAQQSLMNMRQQLLGSNIIPNPIDDSDYKQPDMKKWVNSSLCNKVLENVVQTDISQSFIAIGKLFLDPTKPNQKLIGSICSKLFNYRKQASIQQKPMIKLMNNKFIGYLVTNPSKYEYCSIEEQNQYKRHRCTEVHRAITQKQKDIMDNLEVILQTHKVDIVAFKTDSVFYIDPEGVIQPIVEDYFKSLGLGYDSIKYQKLVHGQSRNSESDVSSYFGLKSNNDIETNGIGMKQNKHLLIPFVKQYFDTNKSDWSLIYKEYYNEMNNLFEQYNEAPNKDKKQLMTNIVIKYRDTKSRFKLSNAQELYTIKYEHKTIKQYQFGTTLRNRDIDFNQTQVYKSISDFNYILTNNREYNLRQYGPINLKSKAIKGDELYSQVEVKIDYIVPGFKIFAPKQCMVYEYHSIDTITQMLMGSDKLNNISVHEALNKDICKLFVDVDCKRTEFPQYWQLSENELVKQVIDEIKQQPLIICQEQITFNSVGYKSETRNSQHIVSNLLVPISIQAQVMLNVAEKFGYYVNEKQEDGTYKKVLESIVDINLYTANRTLRLPFTNKLDMTLGYLKDRVLVPQPKQTKNIEAYLICHKLEQYPVYSDLQFAYTNKSLNIQLKNEFKTDTDTPQLHLLAEEQLFLQWGYKLVPNTFTKSPPENKEDKRHRGYLRIVDYGNDVNCKCCHRVHDQKTNRVKYTWSVYKKDNIKIFSISGFQCGKDRRHPIEIQLGQCLAKTVPKYEYIHELKPTFNQRYIGDYTPLKSNELKHHTLTIIVSDMGTGKSYWVDDCLKLQKGGTLVSTRKSQTQGIQKRNIQYQSYNYVTGDIDVSEHKSIVQFESLKRVVNQFNRPLIIDEFMSVLYQEQGSNTPKKHMEALVNLFSEASSIVIMDQYIPQSVIDFLTDFVKNKMPNDDWNVDVHINGYQQHKDHKVTIYDNVKMAKDDVNKLFNTVIDKCELSKQTVESPNNMGRCVCFIGSRKLSIEAEHFFITKGYKVILINGDNKAKVQKDDGTYETMQERKDRILHELLEVSKVNNIVIYTQCITVGVDIDSPLFKYGVHYFKNNTGSQIQFLQAIHRFRQIKDHTIFTQCMIRIENNYCRNFSIADCYKQSFLLDDYKQISKLERDATSFTFLGNSFYYCLGLLGSEYMVKQLQITGYDVVQGDYKKVNKKVVKPEPIESITTLFEPVQYFSQQELNLDTSEFSFDNFKIFQSQSIDTLMTLFGTAVTNFNELYKMPFGEIFIYSIQMYNAMYNKQLLKLQKVPDYSTFMVGEQEYYCERLNEVYIQPIITLTDGKLVKVDNNQYGPRQLVINGYICIDTNSQALSNYLMKIDSKKLYEHQIENLEAYKTKKHYSKMVHIINEYKDVKLIKKELSRLNKGDGNNYLFTTDQAKKRTKQVTDDQLGVMLKQQLLLQEIDPDLYKTIDIETNPTTKPQHLIDWIDNPKNIQSKFKTLYLQICGYQVHKDTKINQLIIQPIGNTNEELIWCTKEIIKEKVTKKSK